MDLRLFRYGRIHVPTAIVKEESVSRQSKLDLFKYGWIHLRPAIVKENGVSHQSSVDWSNLLTILYR
jgi:hypothetical protein